MTRLDLLAPTRSAVRVMLVDDSPIVRRLLSQVLASEEGVEVVAVARDGQQALETIETARPHVVVLDVEMPVLDGLETLRELRRRWPGLPVVMFSTLTERGAATTLEALSRGANDYVTKPSNTGSLAESVATVRSGLVPLVRMWGGIGQGRTALYGATDPAASPVARPRVAPGGAPRRADEAVIRSATRHPIPIVERERPASVRPAHAVLATVRAVVIGTSTGGPNALSQVIPQLPGDLRVPVFVVQHMPPVFTRSLAERLDQRSALSVAESVPGTVALPGTAAIAAGGTHLVLVRAGAGVTLQHSDAPPENSCRPSVDLLFKSAAEVYGAGLLAVIMTGMGHDGLAGARAVVAAGGSVLAQDEATSVVWSMPGSVVTAGLAAAVVPLAEIADSVVERVRRTPRGGAR